MRDLLTIVFAWSFAAAVTYGLALAGEPSSVWFFRLMGFDI